MKVSIAILMTLLCVGPNWVGTVESKGPTLSQIVFYVK